MKTMNIKQIIPLLAFGIMCGCSSTEVIDDPRSTGGPSDVISLSLLVPKATTRADGTHTLRYNAVLFKKNDKSGEFEAVQRKQMLEGSDGSTLVFEDVETGSYAINLFADYIPVGSAADENGFYPDCYYDTSGTDDIKMKAFGSEIVNNDHFDCFATYVTLEKEEEELHQSISLPRATAKVRVISTTLPQSGPMVVEITKLSPLMSYKIKTTTASDPYNYPTAEVDGGKWSVTPSDITSGEIFYFYTLASGKNREEGLSPLAFTIAADDLDPLSTEFNSGKIKVRQNYITTLSGAFVATPPADPSTRTDRIVLDLFPESDWNAE